jgi:hypothetical protein
MKNRSSFVSSSKNLTTANALIALILMMVSLSFSLKSMANLLCFLGNQSENPIMGNIQQGSWITIFNCNGTLPSNSADRKEARCC